MSTMIEHLVTGIRGSSAYNPNSQAKPVVVLWTDKEQHWRPVLQQLREQLPELLVLGDYDPANKTGPAIWLKCVLSRSLDIGLPENCVPIIYLPKISRAELRAVANCPEHIKPLAELQYRGTVWSQVNGKDWTINAFLTAGSAGIGLDIAQDKYTQDAMRSALSVLLGETVGRLDSKRLEAEDFHRMLSSDPVRDLLEWMNDAEAAPKKLGEARWRALGNITKDRYNFDIARDGVLTAAERLCARQGPWQQIWNRFSESPAIYPSLPALLERVPLPDMLADPAAYPQANADAERQLLEALGKLAKLNRLEIYSKLELLEIEHAVRRASLWAALGKSPCALILEPLIDVSRGVQQSFDGLTPQELGARYTERGWQIDAAAVRALGLCENRQYAALVEAILEAIYTPWLADVNERLQQLVRAKGYPGESEVNEAVAAYQISGEVVFFVDGLRLDVAHQLVAKLAQLGVSGTLSTQWAALPSVTATAKAAVSPIHQALIGSDQNSDFEPSVKDEGVLSHDKFKRLLSKQDWQYLSDDETGDPKGNAWVACGDIDKEGHKSELKLARQIDPILKGIVERITDLQTAGWSKIRIVTDHGWLLVPGKMPKSNLPAQAADSRWGRCARLKPNVEVEGLTLGWYWNATVPIHFPHGIHSFIAGRGYAHGGVSLQECVVPVINILTSVSVATSAQITGVKWVGLMCKVEVDTVSSDLRVDLRTKLADTNSSLVKVKKLEEGKASLMVDDDDNFEKSAMVVVLDSAGNVLCKQLTTVGGDN